MWKFFWKAPLVEKLSSYDVWISRHIVAIFRNICTFQNATSPKATELFKNIFHTCFYPVVMFKNYLFFTSLVEILILLSIMWRHFPVKAVKIKKQKHAIVYNEKVYHPAKVCAQTDKNCKSSFPSMCIFRRKADPEWFWYKAHSHLSKAAC